LYGKRRLIRVGHRSAVVIFNLSINGTNLLGIMSTIAGGAYYSYVEYKAKQSTGKVPLGGASSALSIPLLSGPSSSSDMLGVHSGASLPYPYYEKLSPLPMEGSSNPFAEAQNQSTKLQQARRNEEYYQSQQQHLQKDEIISAAAANAYHRKVDSLAAFREFTYPTSK
jgi:hypothetical protein